MSKVQRCARVLLFCKDQESIFSLLLKRAPDQIHPYQEEAPGGKVELHETVEEAARREVKEESGLIITEKLHPIGDSFFENHLGKFQESFFLCKLLEKKEKITCSKEHNQFRWVNYLHLFQAEFHPGVKIFLENHKDEIDSWVCKEFPQQSKCKETYDCM